MANLVVGASGGIQNIPNPVKIKPKYQELLNRIGAIAIPPSIAAIDEKHSPDGLDHVHMRLGNTLYQDGTWKKGEGIKLNAQEIQFFQLIGFTIPKDNDQFKEPNPHLDRRNKEYSPEEITALSGYKKLPQTVRKVDKVHEVMGQDHIHFFPEPGEVYEKQLNKDGTWKEGRAKELSEEEKMFILALGFSLPKD